MGRSEASLVGANPTYNQHTSHGCITQNPESTRSSPGGLTSTPPTTGEVFYGAPIILGCRVGIAANSPASLTTYRATLLNKNAPSALKVVQIQARMVDVTIGDFTEGDSGNLDVTVIRGNGAVSETETDILADQALNDTTDNGEALFYPAGTVVLTNDTIVSGGSLYVDLLVDPDATAGATNDGATMDVFVTCVPVL